MRIRMVGGRTDCHPDCSSPTQRARKSASAKRREWPTYRMVRRGNRGHLVSIPSVLEVEQFHLLRDLRRRVQFPIPRSERELIGTNLDGREYRTPLSNKFREHAVRPTFFDLAEPAKNGEFIVCHTHIRLQNSVLIGRI